MGLFKEGCRRTEISGKIDGIACLPSKASTNAKDDKEQSQRCQVPGSKVTVILQTVDTEHEDRRGDEFGEELAGLGHEGLRISAEYPRGGVVACDGADVGTTFILIDGGFVVGWKRRV